jgi:hypothetical protein
MICPAFVCLRLTCGGEATENSTTIGEAEAPLFQHTAECGTGPFMPWTAISGLLPVLIRERMALATRFARLAGQSSGRGIYRMLLSRAA